jgi:rhodanese-related sulfurtransferase
MEQKIARVDAATLKGYLHDGHELALFDAREEVPFELRHLLMAGNVPLSRLELQVGYLVPNRDTRVVWCDDGDGLAERAAARMAALGYTDVSILEGGVSAWEAKGYPIYQGVHVPSKGFAEVVEHEAQTPWITAQELKAMMDADADFALFDSRSFAEFNGNSIPGATSVPGAELVLRFPDMVPSPDTTVVVNCGGRTRSIIGAQALIDAGYPNKIVSLRNGTQDWHLAGYEVVVGATKTAPEVSSAGLETARKAAARVARQFDIATADPSEADLSGGRENGRTTYLIDVRTQEEYEAGHLKGAKFVAGGQLIQETERHLGVWGARVLLVDDNGVRATMTASWLTRMGWDVAIIAMASCTGLSLETGPYKAPALGLPAPGVAFMTPEDLRADLDKGAAQIVDLDWSGSFYNGHIPGASWAIRSRLAEALPQLQDAGKIVLTSPDGALAELAAGDLKALTDAPVIALSGGTEAWAARGFPLESGKDRLLCAADDIRLRAREQDTGVEEAMRAYLAWEIALNAQLQADDDQRFRL